MALKLTVHLVSPFESAWPFGDFNWMYCAALPTDK